MHPLQRTTSKLSTSMNLSVDTSVSSRSPESVPSLRGPLRSIDFFNISLDPFTPPETPSQLESPALESNYSPRESLASWFSDDDAQDSDASSLSVKELPKTFLFDYDQLVTKLNHNVHQDGVSRSRTPASSSSSSCGSPASVHSRSSWSSNADRSLDSYLPSTAERPPPNGDDRPRGRSLFRVLVKAPSDTTKMEYSPASIDNFYSRRYSSPTSPTFSLCSCNLSLPEPCPIHPPRTRGISHLLPKLSRKQPKA